MPNVDNDILWKGPDNVDTLLVFAHGAGAPMDHPFMDEMTDRLVDDRTAVARFEFPYMSRRRQTGRRGPPDRQPVLIDRWLQVLTTLAEHAPRIVAGGKSMGGRMATMLPDDTAIAGVFCFGYPFHPPKKPDRLRTEHLEEMSRDTLIVQGTRDIMGNRDEVASYALSERICIHWSEDGDHSLKPRKRSGRTHSQNIEEAAKQVHSWLAKLSSS